MSSKNVPFVHLHFHTEYSLLDGACQVERVMDVAHELGMTAAAITDHGTLYGLVDFYKKAKSKGIKPILGCEAYVAPGDMHDRTPNDARIYFNHLVLLAETNEGYRNLCRLSSMAHLEGVYYKPRIDKALLRKHCKGLIGLSSCLKGEITSFCASNNIDAAVRAANEYSEIFGKNNFFLELQDHGIPEQRIANRGILEVAKRTGLPIVATNDVHYLKAEHAEAHEVLLCLQTQTVMSDPKRMRYSSDQFFMKSGAEMQALFPDQPIALSNTLAIAERCNVSLVLDKELHFPQFKVPEGHNEKTHLLQLAKEGLRARYGIANVDKPKNDAEKRIADRFHFEMSVIEKTGFINYFLVVWDFIRFAHDAGIPVGPGRGSGAGSIVAYALSITGIDPLYYNLIFERFLNPERVSLPDIDVDFCERRRGEVIEYVKEKYGRDNVAQIVTFGTLGPKTVIRDIGRVLEIPLFECDKLAKMVPEHPPGITLDKALEMSPEFREMTQKDPNAKRIMKYARVLEGLPRNHGTHAAGVVIGERPLIELVPLQRDKEDEIITQFEMKPIGSIGLLKMDFLGLKTLTQIQEAVSLIQQTQGVQLDMDKIPMDDAATFALLNRADTVGVFQVESKGMRDLLRRMGLTRIEDLIAMIALFRPGPMNMLDDYVNRKNGRVKLAYDHPLLEPILKETYGVMLYQEQVQQTANVLAGFTLGQGDILRRAMGKKDEKEMGSMREKFVQGCAKLNKIPQKKAEEIFANIERFAGYGFNKSHSAAYAVIAFQTAYLKSHYPVEFMSALLSSEIGNTEKLPVLVAEAQEMGIEVLPPNVNDSEVRFKPMGDKIRYGLAAVKNVGFAAMEALIVERKKNGPYKGFLDFCSRLDPSLVNKRTLENLIKCGAFDFTGLWRGRLVKGIDDAMGRAASAHRDRVAGQASLFDMLGTGATPSDEELPPGEKWSESEMLSAERELLGFYISGHPLSHFEWALKKFSLADTTKLHEMEAGTVTRIGGLVSQYQKRFTKKDQKPMAVFRLEHLDGATEVIVFPSAFEDFGVYLQDEAPVMVCGELSKDQDQLKIKAAEIYPLKDVHKYFTDRVSIHVPASELEESKLWAIKELLGRHPGDTPVTICLQFPTGEKVFVDTHTAFKVAATAELVRDVEHELGEDSVYVQVNPKPCRKQNSGRKPWETRAD